MNQVLGCLVVVVCIVAVVYCSRISRKEFLENQKKLRTIQQGICPECGSSNSIKTEPIRSKDQEGSKGAPQISVFCTACNRDLLLGARCPECYEPLHPYPQIIAETEVSSVHSGFICDKNHRC